MPFPNTPILDTFDRANEGPPLSASWDYPTTSLNAGVMVLDTNVIKGNGVNDNDAYWKTSYGPDCEAYVTLVTWPIADANPGSVWLNLRSTSVGAGGTGGASINTYEVNISSVGTATTLIVYQGLAGTYTTLSTQAIGSGIVSGDILGARIVGATIQAYINGQPVGNPVQSSTHIAAGVIGIGCGSSAIGRFDNFGGGTYAEVTGYDDGDSFQMVQGL